VHHRAVDAAPVPPVRERLHTQNAKTRRQIRFRPVRGDRSESVAYNPMSISGSLAWGTVWGRNAKTERDDGRGGNRWGASPSTTTAVRSGRTLVAGSPPCKRIMRAIGRRAISDDAAAASSATASARACGGSGQCARRN
jgi:hypothetical protein